MPQIEVTFDIDANGIVHVSAKDLGTGKEQKISITGSSGLSKEEVERMQREAETHAEEDKKAKEAIEIRNNADNLAYQCEKQLKDLGDKVPADKKTEIEAKIAAVREALKGSDTDAIKVAYDELQTKFQSASEDLYKQAAASASQPGARPPSFRRRGRARRFPQESRRRRRRCGIRSGGRRQEKVKARLRRPHKTLYRFRQRPSICLTKSFDGCLGVFVIPKPNNKQPNHTTNYGS